MALLPCVHLSICGICIVCRMYVADKDMFDLVYIVYIVTISEDISEACKGIS